MDIFSFMYEPITFDKNKPIKLFEAFSGIGTQSLALKYLGIKDEDFHKAKSSGMFDTQLYKQAGNAIVVDVLMAIFGQMIK